MTVQEILDLIAEQTRDTDNVTWTESDALQYTNEAVKRTIQRAPQANSKKALVDCVAGNDQTLPDDAVELINIIHNDAVSGRAGASIHKTDVVDKDAYSPDWRRTRANSVAIEWMKRSMPAQFMLWPPLDTTRKIMAEYSFYPPNVVALDDDVIVHNDYIEPITNWVLYRTYGRDSEDTPSVKRSIEYKKQFEAFFQQ